MMKRSAMIVMLSELACYWNEVVSYILEKEVAIIHDASIYILTPLVITHQQRNQYERASIGNYSGNVVPMTDV